MKDRILILLITMVLITLGACSPETTALTSTKPFPENQTGMIKKVLVVGVSDNASVRNRFEQEMKKQLERQKLTAVGSLEVLPSDEAINREAFEKYFADQQIDAIVITRVVDVEKTAGFNEGEDYTGAGSGSYVYNYYAYYYQTYDRAAEVGHFEYAEILKIESNVYNVENAKLIWHCESKSFKKDNTLKIIDDLSKLLTRAMKEDGIIQ